MILNHRDTEDTEMEFEAIEVPIKMDNDGVARVGGTRVTLETVIGAFRRGDAAEEIAENFDSLSLADVYGAIAYYLNHREEVDTYIQQRRQEAEEIRQEIEASQPKMFTLRQRLLKKKGQRV